MAWPTSSRQSRGYGAAWDRKRLTILKRDRYLCQPCRRAGRATAATEVNHKTPKAEGGTDDDDNLESICTPCHKAETARQNGQKVKPTIGDDGWPDESRS